MPSERLTGPQDTRAVIGQLRQEWQADLDRRNGILASLARQVGVGDISYQLEYARIGIVREHLAALEDLAPARPLITGNHPRQDGATFPLHD